MSPNGWSSHTLGLYWLESIFHRYTSQLARRGRRLLIVDSHSSYINLRFIELCDRLRILLLILPPHSTYRLQPLDILLFVPLARFYTNNLNSLITNSLGISSISKRDFWSMFWPAWQDAFTASNIISGFTKTGIWLYNPIIVFSKIIQPLEPAPPLSPRRLKIPMTSHTIRRI